MLRAHRSDDAGFGLVEVIVAIFILGLLAVAILPMIWTGLRVAADQSSVASATQQVSKVIEDARTQAASGCEALAISRTATDGQGRTFTLSGEVAGGCSGVLGGVAVKYTATATSSDGKQLATAVTRIYIPAPEGD
jgi:prepilin-type N-terminal cleavage/methylation domain-containing protein